MNAIPPRRIGEFHPVFKEMCFYQYLPVKLAGSDNVAIPERLEPFRAMVDEAMVHANHDDHIYLTVKRGWATTENPLNRPGWHVDAWGHPEDRNLVWCDRFPTRYIWGDIGNVPAEDEIALARFEAAGAEFPDHYVEEEVLYEFGQAVVHATPIIDDPGLRTFVKLSISPHRYNLEGNSHNFLLDYDWPMYPRADVRNDPIAGNKDYA